MEHIMIKIGSEVRIVGLPPNNNYSWAIPREFVDRIGIVMDITNKHIVVDIGGQHWHFPPDHRGVLELIIKNRWNPTGYVPRGERLKLP